MRKACLLACLVLTCSLLTGCRQTKEPSPSMFRSTPIGDSPTQVVPALPPPKEPVVYFHGLFRNQVIPWSEDLTLAAGIVEAEYLGARDPFEITVIRDGVPYKVRANRLLRGLDNPLLEAGDIIEIRR